MGIIFSKIWKIVGKKQCENVILKNVKKYSFSVINHIKKSFFLKRKSYLSVIYSICGKQMKNIR